jgi:hypothetical protein
MSAGAGGVVRAFALPVAVVFGSLGLYAGAMAVVGAAQAPIYAYDGGFPDDESAGDGFADESEEPVEPEQPVIPEPTEEPVAQGPLPASCEDAFSASLKQQMEAAGLVLNPSWSVGEPSYGLAITDSNLRGQLESLPQLKCRWLSPSGGGEVGIETTIAVVTPSQASGVNSRLASLGYTPLTELGGVRYVWEKKATSTSDPHGESHIVLGDLWFATHWLNYGPMGYTADVVTTVMG